jgi:hypothetical protein
MGGMAEAASPPLPPAANGAPRVTVPAPAQGPRVINLAALAKEYVAGAAFQAAADYLRSLPAYIDDVSRDLRTDLYDEMLRTDPVIASSARMVKQSVLSDGITLRPAVDDEDDPLHDDAKAVCDFCTWVASNLRTPAEEVSEDLLSGMFLGNKLAEQVYARLEGGKYPGLWALDRVKPKPRESVRPVVDAYGNFVAVQARIPGDGLLSVVGGGQQISDPKSVRNLLPRSKFAAFVWEPKDADPCGTSILRPCYVNWWQKLQVLGSWLQWLAQCATPMLIGVVGPNADAQVPVDALNNPTGDTAPNPVQQLLNLLIQARSGNALALPTGTTVQWLTPPGRADQFVAALKYHDDCMTRAITLQTLATQDSEHNTRAASQVHQDTLGVGVRKARGVLGRVWTWDVWYWLTYWNFGKAQADALCPRAVLAPVEQHDRQSQLPAYASVGYQLAPSQLQAVDEELGLPQRTPEEAKPPEPPQPPPAGQNGSGNGGPKPPPGGGKGGKPSGQEAGFAWDESKHPRGQPENRGQFGPGGGGPGEGGPPGRPNKLVHERGEEIAERHVANMRALLGRLRSGAMSPEDVASDAQVYADRALEANQRNFAGRYNAFRARVAAEYGEDALRSQKWANVREVFTEARDAAAEQIRDGARVVKAAGDYQARRPGQEVYISRGELEIIRDTLHELRRIHARFVDRLQGEFEDFRAAHKPLPGHAGFSASGQEAPFAFDPDEARDEKGKWTAGGGAAPAWKAEVYRPPGGRYLGRKAETPAGTAQSAALDLGDHARYVWNALADTRDPAERRTQTAAALEEFRHEAHATLHDLARRLGDTPAVHAAADREAARLHDHLGKVAGRALDALEAAGKDRQKVKEARKELRRQLSAVIDRPHAAGGRGRDALAFGAAGRVLRASGQEAGFAGEGDGHWVTIEGEHVFISGGRITKGPAALVGKDPAHLPPRSEARPPAAPAHAQGSPAARAARVKAAFEALPTYDPEDNTRPTPFPTEPVRPYVGADAIRGALWESAPTQDVPLARLTAHQDDINRESVAHAAEHPGEPIQVVRVGGKLYVDDGTNRAAAALLAGEHTVPARVFDYDPATRTYTPVPRGGLGAA